jgi:hypothetical protein
MWGMLLTLGLVGSAAASTPLCSNAGDERIKDDRGTDPGPVQPGGPIWFQDPWMWPDATLSVRALDGQAENEFEVESVQLRSVADRDGQVDLWQAATPLEPLEVGAWMLLVDGEDLGEFGVQIEEDDEAPPIPELTVSPAAASGTYDPNRGGWSYELEARVRLEPEHLLLARVGDQDAFDPETSSGEASIVTQSNAFVLGRDACGDGNWTATPPADTQLRLAQIDRAGNFSGWGEPIVLEVGCGCDVTSSSNGWTGLVPLLFLIRRRV